MDGTAASRRGRWDSKAEYLLACIGYTVGVGTILRFPFVCYLYGGGAFFIPYFITLFVCGIPLLYMEMAIGQMIRLGPLHAIAKLCPIFRGVGISIVLMAFFIISYFTVISAWSFFYIFNSFSSPLPWGSCNNSWNTEMCMDGMGISPVEMYPNYGGTNSSLETFDNLSYVSGNPHFATAGDQYFHNEVLQLSNGIEDMGGMRWQLVGCFLLTWIIYYFCVICGVKSIGKVVYVTATLPLILLIILLVRCYTLPGASDGIMYLLHPDFTKLYVRETWWHAILQHVFTFGIGHGNIIVYSSYNRKVNNILPDVLLLSFVGVATHFIGGFLVFSMVGFVAFNLGISISDIMTGGPDLIFGLLPNIFAYIPSGNVFAVLYFLLIFLLSINFQIAMVEVIVTSVLDVVRKRLSDTRIARIIIALVVCFLSFVFGLTHLTQGGIYTFILFDFYAAYIPGILILYFLVAAVWCYGASRLARNISFSSSYRPYFYIPFSLTFFLPFVVQQLLGFNVFESFPLGYGQYMYPTWTIVVGKIMTFAIIVSVPIGLIYTLVVCKGTCKQRLKQAFTPTFVPSYTRLISPDIVPVIGPSQTGIPMQPMTLPQTDTVQTAPVTFTAPPDTIDSSPPPDFDTATKMETRPFIPEKSQ